MTEGGDLVSLLCRAADREPQGRIVITALPGHAGRVDHV